MPIDGNRLKALREKKGVTPGEVARYLGITRPAYLKYENGQTRHPRKLDELAVYFCVSVDYLLGNTEYIHGNHNKIFGNHTPINSGRQDSPQQEEESSYYHDPEVAQIAQELKENPDLHVLFDASRGLKKESIEEVRKFIEYQKAKEMGDFD